MAVNINHQNDIITTTSTVLKCGDVGGIVVPNGNDNVAKPTAQNGLIRYNTTTNLLEACINNSYVSLAWVNDGLAGNLTNNTYRTISNKTSSYTILESDHKTIFTNNAASADITLTLPTVTVAKALEYEFFVKSTYNIIIQLPSGVTVRNLSDVGSSGGTIYSNTIGNSLKIIMLSLTEWYVENIGGTWTLT